MTKKSTNRPFDLNYCNDKCGYNLQEDITTAVRLIDNIFSGEGSVMFLYRRQVKDMVVLEEV